MARNRVYELQYHAYCAIGPPRRVRNSFEKTFHEKSNASRSTIGAGKSFHVMVPSSLMEFNCSKSYRKDCATVRD